MWFVKLRMVSFYDFICRPQRLSPSTDPMKVGLGQRVVSGNMSEPGELAVLIVEDQKHYLLLVGRVSDITHRRKHVV